MPIVVTREGTSPGADRTTSEQKAAIYKGVTDLFFEIMGKHPDDTSVIFQEVELEDWGATTCRFPSTAASARGKRTVRALEVA